MSIEQEQQIVDTIANETARLSSLRESQRIEVRLKKNRMIPPIPLPLLLNKLGLIRYEQKKLLLSKSAGKKQKKKKASFKQ